MRPKILVACEYSGIVRDAFIKLGHDAISCDLLPTENAGPHYQGNVLDIINNGWDLMIAHPPCTYLAYSGIGHWNKPGRLRKRLEALDFFAKLWEAPINRICIENPKGCASPTIAKYTQSIQPFYFGDSAYKTTWLWLKNLKPLEWKETDDLFGQATAVPPPLPVYVDKNGKARHFSDSFSNYDSRGHCARGWFHEKWVWLCSPPKFIVPPCPLARCANYGVWCASCCRHKEDFLVLKE